jgi:dynein assembly factor 5, axonemal
VLQASALVVLSGLLHAAGTARFPLSGPLLHDVAESLILDEVQSAAEHPAVRAQLLAVIVNILRLCEQAPGTAHPLQQHAAPSAPVVEVSQQVLWVLLQLLGHDLKDDGTAAAAPSGPAADAMQRLAQHCALQSGAQLTAQHAAALLPRVTADEAAWGQSAPNYLVFRALLLTCEAGTLARLMPAIAAVMKPVLEDSERDANLRLSMLRLLDSLLENPTTSPALGGDNSLLTLADLLLPALVWRAGKTAAAVRFAAITTLATMLRKRLVPAGVLERVVNDGSLLPLLFQSLDEDWYVDVRNASCYVMEQLLLAVGGALSHEQVRSVYIELTKRLDDSNNGVRVAACGALRALCGALTSAYCDTNAGYLAQGVLVHMDDSDKAVQVGLGTCNQVGCASDWNVPGASRILF